MPTLPHALHSLLTLAGFEWQQDRWLPAARPGDERSKNETCLTIRVAWIPAALFDCWLGPRLVRWTGELREWPAVSVLSSRLPRPADELPAWFAAWRVVGEELLNRGDWLVVVKSTSTELIARHVSHRLAIPRYEVEVAPDSLTLASWLRHGTNNSISTPVDDRTATTPPVLRCQLSPVLPPELLPSLKWMLPEAQRMEGDSVPAKHVPAADRAHVLLAHRINTLHIRAGGNMEELLRAREQQRAIWPGWMPAQSLLDPTQITAPPPTSIALPPHHDRSANQVGTGPLSAQPSPGTISLDDLPDEPLLVHCTRRHEGRWDDQSWEEYWDELLWERTSKDRSAMAVLRRILTTERLAGSTLAIRGGYRVIGFTAMNLRQLAGARRYQRHRRRWDFEPYGLAIRRDWLERREAKPVCYGDERDWQQMQDCERPFFQQRGRSSRWVAEEEWRLVGDLDLRELPADAAYVLVGDMADLFRLPQDLRWPVVVMPSSARLTNR